MKKKLIATLLAAITVVGCLTGCSVSAGTEVGNIDVLEKFDKGGIVNAEVVIENMAVEPEATKYTHNLDNGSGEYEFTIDSETYTFEIENNEITKVINDDDEVVWTPEMFDEKSDSDISGANVDAVEDFTDEYDKEDQDTGKTDSKNEYKDSNAANFSDTYEKYDDANDSAKSINYKSGSKVMMDTIVDGITVTDGV